jgi:hypothetical protein
MENAPVITMEKEEAKKYYQEYLEATKVRKEKYVEELKNLYRHLSQGAKVLDVYEAFKQSGVNEDGEPKLAIAPASWKTIVFKKQALGAGFFGQNQWAGGKSESVALPSKTFPEWKIVKAPVKWDKDRTEIVREAIQTKVPLVPAVLLPESQSLNGYYILFEVEKWNEVPVARDPYLLKRINANAFVVLGEWDVTEVELSVMRGL